jgi:hypothetical protein
LGAGIVGCGGKSEIAELRAQLGQKLAGFGQRFGGIERLKQFSLGGSTRHELGDA